MSTGLEAEPQQVDTPDRELSHAETAEEREWERLLSIRSASRLPLNVSSGAYVNQLVVASGACKLLGLSGYNSATGSQFIHVFDANTVPGNGAVPDVVLGAAAAANFSYQAGVSLPLMISGRVFKRGIVVCNSSTGATLTIGSADCWLDVQYI